MMNEEKKKALDKVLAEIEKVHGKGTLMRFTDGAQVPVEAIPTGSIAFDAALGIGGMPRGRIVEVYGPESSGKTTVTLHIVAQAQKAGGTCAFIDAEHALDPTYAQRLGVELESFYITQPDNGEQALDIAEDLVKSGVFDVIVIDSVAALIPKIELEGEMGDNFMGLQARLMSKALRKLTGAVNKTKTCIIFINQLREKIGVQYGPTEVTSGGRALKFFASVRVDIRKGEAIKIGEELIGNETKVKIVKNKLAPPFKSCKFDIYYGTGISRESEILDYACDLNVVVKSGSWFSFNDEKIGQGRENVRKALETNHDLLARIEAAVKEKLVL
ncbi:MAG: recombinase RecA [Firmicutes bacterium]|nr:recombinase RecA [Bacillota bacterium]